MSTRNHDVTEPAAKLTTDAPGPREAGKHDDHHPLSPTGCAPSQPGARGTTSAETPVPCSLAPDVWFSDDEDDRQLAISWCRQCPAMARCAAYALAAEERFGIWGGLSPEARGFDSTGRRTTARRTHNAKGPRR